MFVKISKVLILKSLLIYCLISALVVPMASAHLPDRDTSGEETLIYSDTKDEGIPGDDLDYANSFGRDFIADAPWRVMDGEEIPFLFMIVDAGSYLIGTWTILDKIRVYDVNDGGSLVRNIEFGNWLLGETIGDNTSEEVFWAYGANISTDDFVVVNNYIHATVEFDIDLAVDPDPKHLMIYVASDPLPRFNDWYYGDTHFHSIYSRATLDFDLESFTDVEFGAPLFAIRSALKSVGLDWVAITDHSCYLDEDSYNWEYTVEGEPTVVLGNTNWDKWTNMSNEIISLNNDDPEFKFILGEEVTIEGNSLRTVGNITAGGSLHLLTYQDEYIPGENTGTYIAGIIEEFPASIDIEGVLSQVEIDGGFSYAAHPKYDLGFFVQGTVWTWVDYIEALEYDNFRGLQLWNTHSKGLPAANQNNPFPEWLNNPNPDPFEEVEAGISDWDILLQMGLETNPVEGDEPPRQVYIEGGSDAHGDLNYMVSLSGLGETAVDNAAGKVRTLAYCPDGFSIDNVKTALREGQSVATNGPIAVFGIDMDGDDDLISDVDIIVGEKVELDIGQLDNLDLVIKWETTSEFGAIDEIKLKEISPGGVAELLSSEDLDFQGTDIIPLGQFYDSPSNYVCLRLEAFSNPTGVLQDECRCYSNPIWIKINPEIPDLELAVAPINPPVIIPALGGSFQYDITVTNNSGEPVQFDGWTELILPDGSEYGPLTLVENAVIAGNSTIDVSPIQEVPFFAPPGNYSYLVKIGNYPEFVYVEDEFEFEKLDGVALNDPVDDWDLYGWENSTKDYYPVQEIASGFSLEEIYPNPFNPSTSISVNLPEFSHLKVSVFNTLGQEIAILTNENTSAGIHSYDFDGSEFASGIYFVRSHVPGKLDEIRKVVLMK